ncbi:hypothetical protein PVAP13_9NG111146 [Panicum virgatum]|uniref:Uncharacterized protein n=1 Tax=Panicum virgatum TaxID=38727 RepID=A0A8T0MDL0_PANVG|nr:hypothetical protein PVAP13_9NG111146 [Panicum virgatum]
MARRRVRGSRSARWRAGGRWPSAECGDDGPHRAREGDAEAAPKSPASAHTAADGRGLRARKAVPSIRRLQTAGLAGGSTAQIRAGVASSRATGLAEERERGREGGGGGRGLQQGGARSGRRVSERHGWSRLAAEGGGSGPARAVDASDQAKEMK